MRKILFLLVFAPILVSAQNIMHLSSNEFSNNYNSFLNDSTVIIDGRTMEMYNSGYIKNAKNIDAFKPDAEKMLSEFLNKKTIVVYCTMNNRSLTLIEILKENNFKGEIIDITDGITGWKANGFEVVTNNSTINIDENKKDTTIKPTYLQ